MTLPFSRIIKKTVLSLHQLLKKRNLAFILKIAEELPTHTIVTTTKILVYLAFKISKISILAYEISKMSFSVPKMLKKIVSLPLLI